MKKNNIIFKYEKYSELAFIDTLIILDNKKPLIPEDDKNIETSKIIRQIQYSGINIIFLSEDNIDNSISTAKKLGIIEDYEIEKGKKNLKKYTNLVKENLLAIQDNPILLEGNIFYSLCGDIKKEIRKNGNEKITISNIDNFKKVISNLKIISNIRKEDKLILFNGLKQIGIMAITGSSINDLRLLKIANFSFGNNSDYDIFKENYSLILLDNSLNSFWKAYIYSSNLIYKILQYIKFFISTFTSILLINAIGIIIFRDIPINLIPIIFIICIIDIASPPGIVEGNNCNKLLTREKYYKNVPFISNKALLDIVLHIISTIIIIVYLMIKGNNLFNVESDKLLEHNIWNENNGYHVTIIYCVLFFIILIHLALIVIETNNNFIQFGLNICILVFIQIWIVNSGGAIARTKPLSQNDLLKCFGIASLIIPAHLASKIIKI
jgi:Ca2+ transporting ATPase